MKRKLCLPLLFLGLTLMAAPGLAAQAMASALTGSWVPAESQRDQDKVEKVRLDVALDLLSDHYQVLFNYYPELISRHETIKPNLATPKVEDALRRTLRRTGLSFLEVGDNNFVIAPVNDLKELRRTQNRPTKSLDPKPAPATAPASSTTKAGRRDLGQRVEALLREAPDEVILATVRGTVTDENGPLIGVTIRSVQYPSKGAITDLNGEYSLDLPVLTGSLLFSYTGYETQTVAINNRTVLDVQLQTSSELLEEVVVIGYGERSSKDLTGSVSAVSARDIEKSPLITTESALQGRLAGVYISTPGGDPTARPEVQIRGVGTFGSAEPLYVIDGVPITEFGSGSAENDPGAQDLRGSVNILSFVNPNDIASVSVLKDASAAAIYGVRAANGVILITTKKGEKGRPKVSLDASYGVQNPVNRYDVLNVDQYVDLYTDAFNNDPNEELPGIFDPSSPDYLGNRPTTDWQDAAINDNAVVENYGMRISGGSESTTYYLSGGYANQEGSLLEKSLERYSFAGNFTTEVSDIIRAGVNYRLGYVEANDNTRISISSAARAAPWQPVFNPDGTPAETVSVEFDPVENPAVGAPIFEPNDDTFVQLYGPETSANFAGLQQETDNTYDILRNLGSAYLEVEPIKGLRFRGTLSADHYTNTQDQFIGFDRYLYEQVLRNPYVAQDGTSAGRFQRTITENWNLVKEFSINLTKQFGGVHNVDVLLNAMDQKYTFNATFAETGQTLSAAENLRILGGSNEFNQTGGALEQTALQGYMARVSYNFDNKYYIDGTIRRDGSSRFAPDFRWGTFPSVAVAWRMTSEPFLQNSNFLDDLKLRAGWGQLGNQETAAFAFLSTISFSPDYAFGSGSGDPIGRVVNGVRLPNLPNTVLSWETAETFNIGFDAFALRNRLSFTVEYYNRLTKDIIQPTELAPSVGNESSPILNVASVRNNGMEFVTSFRDKIGKFSYGISANFTTVNNEVVKLNNGEPTFSPSGGRIEEGEPLGFIFGYRVDRILRDQADVDAFYANTEDDIAGVNLQPGDIAFQDIAGRDENGDIIMEPDGVVNDADRVNLGSVIPSHYYGFNFDLGYGPFDASIFFQGVGGFQMYNGDRASFECMCGRGDNQSTAVLDRWTPDNRDASLPRAVVSSPGNSRVSDRFVEDAGFLRLRNFQVGYTLPRTVLDNLGFVQNFRVYVAGTNLLTLTNWTGIDPETQGSPPTRSFVFGLNATF